MKKSDKFTSFSSWIMEKRKRRKKTQPEALEQLSSQGLDFTAKSSGFRCRPFQFSDQLYEYVMSFESNLNKQLASIQLDEYNGDFKKQELQLISNYEDDYLEGELISHKFTNTQIRSQLLSQKELLENEVELIDKTMAILKMEVEDDEKL